MRTSVDSQTRTERLERTRQSPASEPRVASFPDAVAQRSTRRTWIVFGALFVLVELVYLFIVTAGTFTHWPVYSHFYDVLGDGFRAGHLYLPVDPPARLLA